jgi:hypothetical protein
LRERARLKVTMRIFLTTLLACIALPAAADAATVSRTGGTLRYEAGKGERIYGSVFETGDGAFVARRVKGAEQRLVPGAGCKRSQPREVRCAGEGVVRVEVSLARARTSNLTLMDVPVALAVSGSPGSNFVTVRRTPDFTYDGGPSRDIVEDVDTPEGRQTIRLGAGADQFSGLSVYPLPSSTPTYTVDGGAGRDVLIGGLGADSLEGGPGADSLEGGRGADTLTGGPGTDTVIFGADTPAPDRPRSEDRPISVTLDGQRNDGSPGQDAQVGPDVENATIRFLAPSSDDVLIGNDGPNLLVGPGTVQGLGGNDTLVTNNPYDDNHTTLDGGDGDDRIGARALYSDGAFATTPASVVCGPGADVVFTNAAAPSDCENANVGMHVLRGRPIGRKGVVRARIDCDDPRGCVLAGLRLKLHGHAASSNVLGKRAIVIPFGKSRRASVQIKPRVWKRDRSDRSLRLEITPVPQPTRIYSPAVSTGSYPRALTLRISR